MERRNKEYVRYRHGICLNETCSKAKSKEVQQIAARKEFVCEECGKPLRECPPPKKGNKTPIVVVTVVLVVALIAAFFIFSGGESKQLTEPQLATKDSDIVKVEKDTIGISEVKKDEPVVEPMKEEKPKVEKTAEKPAKPATSSSNSKNLGYATFKGNLKNGQPNDVNGRLIFKTSHVIDSRDPKGRVAEAGDYVIGEFSEGHLVQGIWYGSDNTVKGSIIIGK